MLGLQCVFFPLYMLHNPYPSPLQRLEVLNYPCTANCMPRPCFYPFIMVFTQCFLGSLSPSAVPLGDSVSIRRTCLLLWPGRYDVHKPVYKTFYPSTATDCAVRKANDLLNCGEKACGAFDRLHIDNRCQLLIKT